MPAPKKYPVELRDRAVRLVEHLLADPGLELSVTGARSRVAEQLCINHDRVRAEASRAQIDAGAKPGVSTDQLRRVNAILKTATSFFAAQLDRLSATLVGFGDRLEHCGGIDLGKPTPPMGAAHHCP